MIIVNCIIILPINNVPYSVMAAGQLTLCTKSCVRAGYPLGEPLDVCLGTAIKIVPET